MASPRRSPQCSRPHRHRSPPTAGRVLPPCYRRTDFASGSTARRSSATPRMAHALTTAPGPVPANTLSPTADSTGEPGGAADRRHYAGKPGLRRVSTTRTPSGATTASQKKPKPAHEATVPTAETARLRQPSCGRPRNANKIEKRRGQQKGSAACGNAPTLCPCGTRPRRSRRYPARMSGFQLLDVHILKRHHPALLTKRAGRYISNPGVVHLDLEVDLAVGVAHVQVDLVGQVEPALRLHHVGELADNVAVLPVELQLHLGLVLLEIFRAHRTPPSMATSSPTGAGGRGCSPNATPTDSGASQTQRLGGLGTGRRARGDGCCARRRGDVHIEKRARCTGRAGSSPLLLVGDVTLCSEEQNPGMAARSTISRSRVTWPQWRRHARGTGRPSDASRARPARRREAVGRRTRADRSGTPARGESGQVQTCRPRGPHRTVG